VYLLPFNKPGKDPANPDNYRLKSFISKNCLAYNASNGGID